MGYLHSWFSLSGGHTCISLLGGYDGVQECVVISRLVICDVAGGEGEESGHSN